VIREGLEQTEGLWPEVRAGFDLLKQMAAVLKNEDRRTGEQVRQRFGQVVERMAQAAQRARQSGQENLAEALEHCVKVSGSYQPDLFHCYDVADLQPTNNELEQVFGSARHHERRVSGRKQGSESLVLRGGVRLVAALATRLEEISAEQLAPRDPEKWRQKRAELGRRRRARAQQKRFRRNPDAFLRELEDKLSQSRLPA
jgi:hypothetical protein